MLRVIYFLETAAKEYIKKNRKGRGSKITLAGSNIWEADGPSGLSTYKVL